jgi:hypothetical protein
VKRCYARCEDACNGDQVALPICQRSCRNASCLAIKAKCTLNERNQDKIDPKYTQCCCAKDDPTDCGDCKTPDEAECETTTTTTSTTSSTTTSVVQPTTSTTSPQLP